VAREERGRVHVVLAARAERGGEAALGDRAARLGRVRVGVWVRVRVGAGVRVRVRVRVGVGVRVRVRVRG